MILTYRECYVKRVLSFTSSKFKVIENCYGCCVLEINRGQLNGKNGHLSAAKKVSPTAF